LPGLPLRSRTNDWSMEDASSAASSSVSAAIALIAAMTYGLASASEGWKRSR
jgi:hypothetical protein